MQRPRQEAVGEVANPNEHQDGNKLGVKAGCIAGLKKCQYDNADFGVIVMSSYAASHASS